MRKSPLLPVLQLTLLLALIVGFVPSAAAHEGKAGLLGISRGTADPFPNPPGLRKAVDFWRQVFGRWRRDQVVLHDNEFLGAVYKVIDLPAPTGDSLTAWQKELIQQQRDALAGELQALEHRVRHNLPLSGEDKRLYNLLEQAEGKHAVFGAARRLRSQRGMRERFLQGLQNSGPYNAQIRQVFKDAGLPPELAYLPHVESSFVNHARSHAGAAGVWQFMRSTGVQYMMINDAVDERFDPVLAARGAARYLKSAHGRLGDWGLAITSYNHGINGMTAAKRQYGTDIEKIVRYYKSRLFGFASRNFYAEFLAVRSIIANLDRHFPDGVRFAAPMDHARVRLTRSVTFSHLANIYGVSPRVLESMNPALSEKAAKGRIALPAGAEIWLPPQAPAGTTTAYAQRVETFDAEMPNYLASQSHRAPRSDAGRYSSRPMRHLTHTVRKGESPHRIASKYGVKVREIMALNDLKLNTVIHPGQRLRIPVKK